MQYNVRVGAYRQRRALKQGLTIPVFFATIRHVLGFVTDRPTCMIDRAMKSRHGLDCPPTSDIEQFRMMAQREIAESS